MPTNSVERKFIDLKSLTVSGDEGPGTIEGYRAVFNVIDEGGDIMLPGAFKANLDEYLQSGFTAHSHDWDFDKAVGFPIEAHEDEHGWFVKSQFHSTPDAQLVRTKARERMEAGKTVGFSFGYAPTEYEYIEAKDYKDRLAEYVSPEYLPTALAKAQRFARLRLLKAVEVIEDSLVTAPMNKLAMATALKSESELADNVKSLIETHGPEAIINQINQGLDEPDRYLKGIAGTESFESFESAGAALEKFAQKMRANHEIRLKEGRVLSSSNRAKVQACKESMTALIADLDDLLAISEPKPKEKEIDVDALRTQSLRLRSQVFLTLAQQH